MAFRSRDLSVLAYANGFTLWHYRTEDDAAAILCPAHGARESGGYFESACELLRTGDRIMVSLSHSRPAMLDLLVTAAGPDRGVTVTAAGEPLRSNRASVVSAGAGFADSSPAGEASAA